LGTGGDFQVKILTFCKEKGYRIEDVDLFAKTEKKI
jgi:hypothetical protein